MERLDRVLTAAALRHDRALRSIAEYRDSLLQTFSRAPTGSYPRLIAAGKQPN
jgi:hypothetical protein